MSKKERKNLGNITEQPQKSLLRCRCLRIPGGIGIVREYIEGNNTHKRDNAKCDFENLINDPKVPANVAFIEMEMEMKMK